jgi:hypothetical protein
MFRILTQPSRSEVQGAANNKPVALGLRPATTAWPMQGGLQSITNTTTARTNVPIVAASAPYNEAPSKTATNIPRVSETAGTIKTAKTPSPKRVTIKVEPASGKENFITTTPQSNK